MSKMVYNTVGGLGDTAGDDGGDEANRDREEESNEGARKEYRNVECSLGAEHTKMELADLPCHSRKLLIDLFMSRSKDTVGDREDREDREDGD